MPEVLSCSRLGQRWAVFGRITQLKAGRARGPDFANHAGCLALSRSTRDHAAKVCVS